MITVTCALSPTTSLTDCCTIVDGHICLYTRSDWVMPLPSCPHQLPFSVTKVMEPHQVSDSVLPLGGVCVWLRRAILRLYECPKT